MEAVLLYLVKVAAAGAILVVTYLALYRKENALWFNRTYLLSAAILPWIIPLVTLTINRTLELQAASAIIHTIPEGEVISPGMTGPVAGRQGLLPAISTDLFVPFLFAMYLAGLLFFLFRLGMSFVKVNQIIRRCTRKSLGSDTVYVSEDDHEPFSFFGKRVISRHMLSHTDLSLILRHERAHSAQGHSYDIVATEIVKALQWFNPFAWMLVSQVKTNLEYMADAVIAEAGGDVEKYQYMLISLANGDMSVPLVSRFSQTQLMKRMIMMKKQVNPKKLTGRCLVAIPVLALLLLSFSNRDVRYVTQDELVVTGQVTTVAGHIPIPRVYIGVKGEIVGAATDADGNYSIRLNSPADTLEMIYSGTKLIIPNGRTHIDVSLDDANSLLANIFRILGPDADPVVVLNDRRVEKGLKGIDPGRIQSLQVLEGEKAVQAFGSEEARKGLVIIKGHSGSYYADDMIIFLDGKRFDGPMEAIHPHFFITVGGFSNDMFLMPGEEAESPILYRFISTRKPRIREINSEILEIIDGENTMDLSDEPITVVNGRRYLKGLRTIRPDDIISAEYIVGQDAFEASGLEEARKRGIAFITCKIPSE